MAIMATVLSTALVLLFMMPYLGDKEKRSAETWHITRLRAFLCGLPAAAFVLISVITSPEPASGERMLIDAVYDNIPVSHYLLLSILLWSGEFGLSRKYLKSLLDTAVIMVMFLLNAAVLGMGWSALYELVRVA